VSKVAALPCRGCGALPSESVSDQAVEYTCSLCLMGRTPAIAATRAGLPAPRKHPTSSLCALNGNHAPGSTWAEECPLQAARVAGRVERARRAAAARWNKAEPSVAQEPEPKADGLGADDEPHRRACRRHRDIWRLACPECNPEAPRAELDPNGPEWRSLRSRVMQRDGRRCRHCGTTERLSVHHITPRPEGTNDPRNLVTLCSTCHDAVEQPAEVANA
jgi:hypothetical protein